MREWLLKTRSMKALPWVLVLLCCAAALLLTRFSSAAPGSGMTQEEARISLTLQAIQGAGETRVSIYYAQETASFGASAARQPVGAVVVAQGAGSVRVRLALQRAAETLLGLSPGQVEVFVMEERK